MGRLWNAARAFGTLSKVIGWDTLVRGEQVDMQMPRGCRRLTETSTPSEKRVLTFRPNTESERFWDLCWLALASARSPRDEDSPSAALEVWLRVGSSPTDVEVLVGRNSLMGWTSLAEDEHARMRSLAEHQVYADGTLEVEQADTRSRVRAGRLQVAVPG
jgi:hypothetical protein